MCGEPRQPGFWRGKVRIADDFDELPITFAHAMAAGELPDHHSDPFDRMLVAQTKHENLMLMTRDKNIAKYEAPVLPA